MSKLIHQLQKKAYFKPKFLIFLVVVVIISFLIMRFITGEITNLIKREQYKVNIIDEQDIYKGSSRSIQDDVSLLKPLIK